MELIDDLVRDQHVETVSLYTNGPFTDLCRGPHAPEHRPDQGVQAAVGGRRLLARRRQPDDAHARVWDRVLLPQGSRGASRAPRARAGQRPPAPRPPAGAVHVLRGRAGGGVLAAGRDRGVQLAGAPEPGDGPRARLPGGQDAADLRQRPVEDLRPLGQVPGEHVRHRVRGALDGGQADELPRALPALLARAPLLPRPAASATGSRACSTAASRAARCTGCCGCGTSPRTTRTSSAPRTRSRTRWPACSSSRSRPTGSSASTSASSSPPGRSSGSAPRSCGTAASRR